MILTVNVDKLLGSYTQQAYRAFLRRVKNFFAVKKIAKTFVIDFCMLPKTRKYGYLASSKFRL